MYLKVITNIISFWQINFNKNSDFLIFFKIKLFYEKKLWHEVGHWYEKFLPYNPWAKYKLIFYFKFIFFCLSNIFFSPAESIVYKASFNSDYLNSWTIFILPQSMIKRLA